MSNILKCPSCGKETPESGIIFKDNDIKRALEAPLDFSGVPQYDYSSLSGVKTANYCYWCNADIDKINAESKAKLEAERKAKREAELKEKEEAARLAEKTRKIKRFIKIGGVVIIGLVLFLWVKSCGSDSDNDTFGEDTYHEVSSVTDADGQSGSAETVLSDGQNSSTTEDMTFRARDYSKEWAKIEERVKKLGTPLEYVNAHSGENSSQIKQQAEKEYESIKKEAEALYDKIKSEGEGEYERIKTASEAQYEAIKDKAYEKYQNEETDYSTYSQISSDAYSKYSDIRSTAYSKYSDIRSAAYSKYSDIKSEAYSWKSKVSSICYNLD